MLLIKRTKCISNVHKGKKPYACSNCACATSHRPNLLRHIDHVHKKKEQPKQVPKNSSKKLSKDFE